MTVIVAQNASPGQFGLFATVQVAGFALIQAVRSTIGTTLLTERDPRRPHSAGTTPIVLLLGLVVGVVVCMSGLTLLRGDTAVVLVTAGASLPGQLLSERVRLEMFAAGRSSIAPAFGVSFLVLFAGILLVLDASNLAWWCMPLLALGLAGLVAGSVAHVFLRAGFSPRDAVGLWGLNRRKWGGLLATYCSHTLAWLGVPFAVAAASGLAAAGALRGAQALAALPQQVPQGLQSPTLRSWTDKFSSLGSISRFHLRRWNLLQVALFAPVVGLSVAIPDEVGRMILGETWSIAGSVLPIVLVSAALSSISLGVELQLRVVGSIKPFLYIRSLMVAPTLVGCYVGGAVAGALGAALALALSQLAIQALAVFALRRAR